MLDVALKVFFALPSTWRWAIIGAGAISLVGVYTGWHIHIYNSGYNAAIHKIAARDQEAVNAAASARARIDDCNSTDGMHWSVESGKCLEGGM